MPTDPEPIPAEQPTAPYLEAVAAYGLRGSTRFHVPGHKGGEGADPGPAQRARRRRAAARRAAGHRGHRHRPVADALPARRAARRRGLRRRALLVPDQRRDAGQPRALPGAGGRRPGPEPCAAAAQLTREHDRRARALRRAAALRRARIRPRARAWPMASRPRRSTRALLAGRSLCRRLHRLADLLRDGGRRRGLCRGRAPRRRAADRRLRLGRALRLPRCAAALAAGARRRRDARLDAQDRRQPHAVGDAAGRRFHARRRGRDRTRDPARALDQPERAADGVARRRPPPACGARRAAARPHDQGGGAST